MHYYFSSQEPIYHAHIFLLQSSNNYPNPNDKGNDSSSDNNNANDGSNEDNGAYETIIMYY